MKIRLPAEWEPVHAVMLTWPRRDGDWSGHFEEIHQCYLGIVDAIQPHANLVISAASEELAEMIRLDIGDIENVSIFTVASDDTWVRDHGPITVYEDDQPVLLDFIFNGWGNKYPSENDNWITASLYNADAFPGYDYQQVDFILEGGSIDTDGQGTLLTTTSCLLAATRNAGMDRQQIERVLCDRLGIDHVLWLTHSELMGDDTDGHIDMLARFVDQQTIVYTSCENPDDANYPSLHNMKMELENLRDRHGEAFTLVALPMPDPVFDDDGLQLPASYANFLVVNRAVLVPAYGVEQDETARSVLASLFDGHDVISVPCRALIKQFGSLHCATMQIPQ